jgi:hypothetical protein
LSDAQWKLEIDAVKRAISNKAHGSFAKKMRDANFFGESQRADRQA